MPDKFFNLPTINDGFLKLQKQIIIPMKHSLVFLIQLLMLTAISCAAQNNHSAQNALAGTGTYLELQKFQREPDSLLTENEKIKKQTLFNLIKEKVSVRNNQFYSSATRKDFTEKGLSECYYDILEKSIRETNQWAKDENISNLDSLYQSSIKDAFMKTK